MTAVLTPLFSAYRAAHAFVNRNRRVRVPSIIAAGTLLTATTVSMIPYATEGTLGCFVMIYFFGGLVAIYNLYPESHYETVLFAFSAGIPYFAWEAWNLPVFVLWIPFSIACVDIVFLRRKKTVSKVTKEMSET